MSPLVKEALGVFVLERKDPIPLEKAMRAGEILAAEVSRLTQMVEAQPGHQLPDFYELRDGTDEEIYYTVGYYRTLDEARVAATTGDEPISEHAEEGNGCTLVIYGHYFEPTRKQSKRIEEHVWVGEYPSDNLQDDWVWRLRASAPPSETDNAKDEQPTRKPAPRVRSSAGYAKVYELETRIDSDGPWTTVRWSRCSTVEAARRNIRDLRVIANFNYDIRIVCQTGSGAEVVESHNDEDERRASGN